MDYSKVIDLDGITLEDCERFYANVKRLIVNDGRVINIRDSEDITYTIENMACDDWTIADNCGAKGEI